MLNSSGTKKKTNTTQIKNLKPSDKFLLYENDKLKGVVLHISDMETSVYWYSIPDRWFKENYDEVTLINDSGDYYEGLDTYFFKKKVSISSSTTVIKIKKGE